MKYIGILELCFSYTFYCYDKTPTQLTEEFWEGFTISEGESFTIMAGSTKTGK